VDSWALLMRLNTVEHRGVKRLPFSDDLEWLRERLGIRAGWAIQVQKWGRHGSREKCSTV
jgi:hypothetical protein